MLAEVAVFDFVMTKRSCLEAGTLSIIPGLWVSKQRAECST